MRRFLLILVMTLGAAGCSASGLIDRIPTSVGGLPDDAPQRDPNSGPYPGVYNAAQRSEAALTSVEQLKLQSDLSQARAQQQQQVDPAAITKANQEAEEVTTAGEKARAAGEQLNRAARRR